MSDVAIRVMGLGKEYQIGARAPRHKTLRESLMQVFNEPFRRLRHYGESPVEGNPTDRIWALQDVSFDVKRGEVVGVIGRNGAGKSTLLKILSRITEPTKGSVEIRGRVGALLEVGTGFHSELTGRENIYLNGAILGMRRAETSRKFDEIVAFAEVEKFIDTPVKHYSSGMYMRLAFAVAAHLELEILLVDEVLAVGDVAFQKKCMGKMGEVRNEGRTVLFVSHNMAAIEALSSRCILLQSGNLIFDADTRSTVAHYFQSTTEQKSVSVRDWKERAGTGEARIVKFATLGQNDVPLHVFRPGEPIKMLIGIEFQEALVADVAVVVETATERALFTTHLSDHCELRKSANYREFSVLLSPNYLRQGQYLVSLAVFTEDMQRFYDAVYHFPAFAVEGHPETISFPRDGRWGELYFHFAWEVGNE